MPVSVEETIQKVAVVDDLNVVVVQSQAVQVVQIEDGGPAGPQGPSGVTADLLANRPASAEEGAVFAATDTDAVFVWFI